jgi:hypothetical protein
MDAHMPFVLDLRFSCLFDKSEENKGRDRILLFERSDEIKRAVDYISTRYDVASLKATAPWVESFLE